MNGGLATNFPDWVWRLVAAVDGYEDVHGHAERDGAHCFDSVMDLVPVEVRTAARLAKLWAEQAERVRQAEAVEAARDAAGQDGPPPPWVSEP